jgi:O-antigen/teichoic acid export membrane protein
MVAKFFLTVLGLAVLCAVVLAVPSLRPELPLFLISFVSVVGYFLFPLWLYQGMQKLGSVAMRDFLAKAMSMVALLVFVHSDRDYLLTAATQSGGLLVAGLIGLLTVKPKLGVTFRWPAWAQVKSEYSTGRPAFLSLAVLAFTFTTNTFVVGLVASASEIAYFSVAWRIIATLRALYNPLSMAVYPHASQKAVRSEEEVIRFVHHYRWIFAGPFLAGGVCLLGGALPLFRLLGPKYDQSALILQIMAFVPALFAFTQIYSTYHMLACGYDKEWMRVILISVAANFVILAVAIFTVRGAVALALTTLGSEAVSAFLYWRFFVSRAKALAL